MNKALQLNNCDVQRIIPLNPNKSFPPESCPFSISDTTAGVENELQVCVASDREHSDLVSSIVESNYYRNLLRRTKSGDSPGKIIRRLNDFVNSNSSGVWENSWVRFPESCLSPGARKILSCDLLRDKSDRKGPRRSDSDTFFVEKEGTVFLRLPVSYVLKLAFAEAAAAGDSAGSTGPRNVRWMMKHFLNDNSSPETFSFYTTSISPGNKYGKAPARETALRYLLTRLLTEFANTRFKLREHGQEAMVYLAPHPPQRQKRLNDIIPDSFYRELFMSPCLSGWDKGEEKHNYMRLCHQVLSRSSLNAISKLREAGITYGHLTYLKNISNVSLANNGTHVSLGSRTLNSLMGDSCSGFRPANEKFNGDLVIKIMEHFLPLFVGTFSAAPYRLAFEDFHPESVLGFLPHELDFTHLRMMWRRWKKKANLKILGYSVTPFGLDGLDSVIARTFRIRGDYTSDYRLVDYFAWILSTDESPALDGSMGNVDRLKKDLTTMGIFDNEMSVYLLYKLREFQKMGFSGFEGRYYSQFESFLGDMAPAVTLQFILTSVAYRYVLDRTITPEMIPDGPIIESERRQIFFDSAIGIPTFYIKKNTPNQFLRRIISYTQKTRSSNRYPGYLRVYNREYRLALVRIIREDAADLLEDRELRDTVNNLEQRLIFPEESSAEWKLTRGILKRTGESSPMKTSASSFNNVAELYYRHDLAKRNTDEAGEILLGELSEMCSSPGFMRNYMPDLKNISSNQNLHEGAKRLIGRFTASTADESEVQDLIRITSAVISFRKALEAK